jgi:HNH endonuclease
MKGGQLKIRLDSSRYPCYVIHLDGKQQKIAVHRVLAGLYLPKVPGKDRLLHKDLDRQNYALENLQWATASEIIKHGDFHVRGVDNPNAKLAEKDVHLICKIFKEGVPRPVIYKMFSEVTWRSVYQILNGETWQHITHLYGINPR